MNTRHIVWISGPEDCRYLYLKGFTRVDPFEVPSPVFAPVYTGPQESAPIWTADMRHAMTYERVDHAEAVALGLEARTLEVQV